jgi:predicted 2-oxoglutarate/Fe(II)-dependent dioxygenase YbiX
MTIGLFPGELKASATVGGCIDIFENAWPNPDEAIAFVERECADIDSGVNWNRATTIGQGIYQDARTNMDLGVSCLAEATGNRLMKDIHNQMYFLLLASLGPYSQKYGIKEPLHHEQYNMLKYKSGQEYKAHYDGGSSTQRAVSAICYLNGDFEGGEIEFPNFKVKIKPEPGMLILFPSNYAYSHVAHPVTAGTKYALVTWIHDQPINYPMR